MVDFKLVDRDWGGEIDRAVASGPRAIKLVCPFIKKASVERLLRGGRRKFEVVTRFDLNGFHEGVSDIEALRLLIEAEGKVRGVKGLHSKLFLFDRHRAIAGSANLTEAAMRKNHEFGFVTGEQWIIDRCHGYFDRLWGVSGADATIEDLEAWSARVDSARRIYARTRPNLPDYGVSAQLGEEDSPFVEGEPSAPDGAQTFVKFFGSGNNRAPLSDSIEKHVLRGGCHWAYTYGKRPRNVQDGAKMFMARVTRGPNDIRIFGQAIGRRHRDGIDDASPAEINERDWKARWPYYVRVHSPQILHGCLSDGISLSDLMDRFGSNSFMPTWRNASQGIGNTNPRRSLSQQPQIELTSASAAWLAEQMDQAYNRLGTIDLTEPQFDWPREARVVSP